ncbi:hypothetical protein AVEN_158179-1 [Araneus ventricosus]|uniref:Uncharacterized protein n=1 Tax=Araneus ventricosus TaxID=182803 RepID=A0A4Y2G4H7_ARAVE|nr:hypothetical protein AVEN_158179-1 [Araneus ventricosus]
MVMKTITFVVSMEELQGVTSKYCESPHKSKMGTTRLSATLSTCSEIQGEFEKFGEWTHKIKETMYANIIPLLAFKVITISYNTLLTSVVQLLETVSKHCFRYHSKHR